MAAQHARYQKGQLFFGIRLVIFLGDGPDVTHPVDFAVDRSTYE
jgi:hypothetical protein